MSENIKDYPLVIFTKKGLMLEKSSDYLRLPGKSGDIGVSYDHTPSLVECTEGEMLIKSSDQLHGFFITDSIAHINKDSVTVIVNHLESIDKLFILEEICNFSKSWVYYNNDAVLERCV